MDPEAPSQVASNNQPWGFQCLTNTELRIPGRSVSPDLQ
jgi:hypothetical protein